METSNSGTDPTPAAEYFTIPGDLVIDILFILSTYNLHYHIKAVNREENSILLYLPREEQPAHRAMAIENIESILRDYHYYLNGMPEKSLWE